MHEVPALQSLDLGCGSEQTCSANRAIALQALAEAVVLRSIEGDARVAIHTMVEVLPRRHPKGVGHRHASQAHHTRVNFPDVMVGRNIIHVASFVNQEGPVGSCNILHDLTDRTKLWMHRREIRIMVVCLNTTGSNFFRDPSHTPACRVQMRTKEFPEPQTAGLSLRSSRTSPKPFPRRQMLQ